MVYDLFGITRSGENVELIAIDISKSLNSDEDPPLRCVLRQILLGTNIESQVEGWKDFDFSSKEWEGVSGEAGSTKLAFILESKLKQLGTK